LAVFSSHCNNKIKLELLEAETSCIRELPISRILGLILVVIIHQTDGVIGSFLHAQLREVLEMAGLQFLACMHVKQRDLLLFNSHVFCTREQHQMHLKV
jgi:hypothetical protein